MSYGQKFGLAARRANQERGVPALVELGSELRQFTGEMAVYLFYMKIKDGLKDDMIDRILDLVFDGTIPTWRNVGDSARSGLINVGRDAVGFAASTPFSYMTTIGEQFGELNAKIRPKKLSLRNDLVLSLYLIVPWIVLASCKQMGWHQNIVWYTLSLAHDFFSRILAAKLLASWLCLGIQLYHVCDIRITSSKRLLSHYARKLLEEATYLSCKVTANVFYYVSLLTSQQQVAARVEQKLAPLGIRPYQRDIVVNLLQGVGQAMHVFLVAMAIGFLLYVVNPVGQAAALSGYLWLGLGGFFVVLAARELYTFYHAVIQARNHT